MSADEDSDDDAATMIGKADLVRDVAPRGPAARDGVESATRKFDVRGLSGPTKAMPSGYGIEQLERDALARPIAAPQPRPSQSSGFRGAARTVPTARASAPRPAAGRPAVPSVVDDPTSESEMTLIEAIDAELESITAELSIPEGTDASLLEDAVSSSEMTVRMAVPDDLPSDLLDSTSEPGTQIQPPRASGPPAIREMRGAPAPPLSLSSMPTPQRHTRTAALPAPRGHLTDLVTAEPPDHRSSSSSSSSSSAVATSAAPANGAASHAAPAALSSVDLVSAERPRGPAPKWVGRYLAVCALFSILGAVVLAYLKMQRFW